jgi:hypothetical protein
MSDPLKSLHPGVKRRFEEANAAIERGEYSPAALNIAWLLTAAPTLYASADALRISHLIPPSRRLYRLYPPFAGFLTSVRDEAEKCLAQPGATLEHLRLFVTINCIANDDERSVKWYARHRQEAWARDMLAGSSVWSRLFDACKGNWSLALAGRLSRQSLKEARGDDAGGTGSLAAGL